jgi:hypothetical protein
MIAMMILITIIVLAVPALMGGVVVSFMILE